MFDIGGGELLLIILVVLMLFGPKKIPEIARTLGKGMAQLRRAQAEFQRNINDVSSDIERTAGIESNPRPFRTVQSPAQAPLQPADKVQTEGQAPPTPVIRPAEQTVARTPGVPPVSDAPADTADVERPS